MTNTNGHLLGIHKN